MKFRSRRAPRRPGVLVVASLVAWSAAAGPGAAGPPGARPQTPVTQEPADDCNLRPSAHNSIRDERGSCLRVDARVPSVPAAGQVAELRFSVTAAAARDVTYRIKLTPNLEFAGAPRGTETGAGPSPWGDGTMTPLATGATRLAAGETKEFVVGFKATGGGPAQIEVQADASNGANRDGAADHVFFTLGTRGASVPSLPDATQGGTRPAAGPAVAGSPGGAQVLPTLVAGAPRVSPLATSCVTGTWNYLDQNGTTRPSRNYRVEAWDADPDSADDLLAVGTTSNGNGSYNLCFDNSEPDGAEEVYVRFISENSLWRVRDTPAGNQSYVNSTVTVSLPDGASHDFGSLQPANDPPIHRALHAFDSINDFWNWKPGYCFDALDVTCRQMIVNWTPGSTEGNFYDLVTDNVFLAADAPDFPDTTIHEAAHAVMDDVYEDNYPETPNCVPHTLFLVSSAGCAWTEGFAEWVPASVSGDSTYRGTSLENPNWNTIGWDDGDEVEGRVAAAMIDIADGGFELWWDRGDSEGASNSQWDTLLHTHSSTFREFFLVDRLSRGHDTGHEVARASVFQNTIDYDFRDPLTDQEELVRPSLQFEPSPHNFRYDTSAPFWSATAIRPGQEVDYDLRLFDGPNLTRVLASSNFGPGNVDYVVVDSRNRPLGDYYPQVSRYSGNSLYEIEAHHGGIILGDGRVSVTMTAREVVQIRDTFLSGSVPTFFRIRPSNPRQDGELFLHQSDPANPTTWAQGRYAGVAASAGAGPGSPEAFSHTSAAGGWHGLVLVNLQYESGTYTLYRDTTASTAVVVINNGAASTTSPDVTLNLTADDFDTGVELMQISIDGALDNEPWVAFSPTSTVMLPGGAGAKTVLARFRNNAGMDSAVASGTITLQSG